MKTYCEVHKETGKVIAGPFTRDADDIPDFGESFHLQAVEVLGTVKEGHYYDFETGTFREPTAEESPPPEPIPEPVEPPIVVNPELRDLLIEVIDQTGVEVNLSPKGKSSVAKLKALKP